MARTRIGLYPPSVMPGIPQLGTKPVGWTETTFGDSLRVVQRPAQIKDDDDYLLVVAKRSRGGIVSRGNLQGREIKTKSQFYINAGDFLISRRQIIHGACGIVPSELDGAIVSNEYDVLLPNDNLIIDYLNYFTHTVYFQQTCFHSSVGVDVEKMIFRLGQWFDNKIYLPPLEEQRKIAAILSTWDAAIGLVEQLIAALGRRKQALMQLLLTGAVRFAGFEGAWEETELKEVVTMLSGGTPSKENPDYWNGEIPWISAKSMHSIYVSDSEDKITLEGARNGSRLVPAETVLILVRGSMLFKRIPVCLTTREVAFNQDLKALISRGKISPTFLLYSLIAQENQILSQIEITGMGAGKISSDILSLMPISIPPQNEQNKISETLKLCDAELDTLREYSGTLREQKRGLMQQLLTGAVRV